MQELIIDCRDEFPCRRAMLRGSSGQSGVLSRRIIDALLTART